MTRALAAAALLAGLFGGALGPGRPAAAQGWVEKGVAELQMLDKVTARIAILKAPVGQPTPYGTLTVLVRACNARPPDEVPDAAAFLEIIDSRHPNEFAFRGWMFANVPAVSMLEHPVYDVRVLDCR